MTCTMSVECIVCETDARMGSYWVPSLGGGESICSASRIVALRDVIQDAGTKFVQDRVHKSKRTASLAEERVIQERDEAADTRTCCARSRDGNGLSATNHLKVLCLRSNVRKRTPGRIEETFVDFSQVVEVIRNSIILVRGACEDVGEPAGRK